jgi:eukaryotic-like serine/threonine-protein kinase
MPQQVTLLRRDARSPVTRPSSSLPPDLLEQVRGRVQLLAALLLFAFVFDPLLYFGAHAYYAVQRIPLPPDSFKSTGFALVDVGAAAASAALWWGARSRRVTSSRLHTIGLAYEIAICFTIALVGYWNYYEANHLLPNLTWVPVVIVLFPLILPGPPLRMLAASIAAASMSLVALGLLDTLGKVDAVLDSYVQDVIHSVFAVSFAYMGARVVYRLGREVAAARELGSYQLEERLGEGGMGEVWRARHRMLARPAAIKLIRPSLTMDGLEDAARRFEREAQVIARLRSPHTVELFDFGVAENGSFYYAMELLEGVDADALVRRFGPVTPARAVHMLLQMCHSLSEAESCGVVHRDIKPANIFVCRYGEDLDFVKVLDFGLVKATGDTSLTAAPLTRQDLITGTPAFIAPEQAMGQTDIDGRADLYATGCVAYWLLTGELVFTAETAMALAMHHIQTQPVAPSARSAQPIPPALDAVVLACLAKNPDDRPQTARALGRALSDAIGGAVWTQDQAKTWWAAHQPVTAPTAPVPERTANRETRMAL